MRRRQINFLGDGGAGGFGVSAAQRREQFAVRPFGVPHHLRAPGGGGQERAGAQPGQLNEIDEQSGARGAVERHVKN